MPDLLTAIRRDLASRVAELQPLAAEYAHLERALSALDAAPAAAPRAARQSTRKASTGRGHGGASRRRKGTRSRTTERTLAYITEHGPSTASDIANAEGLEVRAVAPTLVRLVKAGRLVKAEPRGYALPAAAEGGTD